VKLWDGGDSDVSPELERFPQERTLPYESCNTAPTFSMIKTVAIVCGALILLLIVVALIVYLTLSNPGLLDFGLHDGVFPVAEGSVVSELGS